ncbi:MAG TPA: murein biosynthesis integral membrane protein MurJ [Candidatus Atribacteria bacterium]|nr:murein biosynthesis integral membrane protein MurJ [Candidatus Atribacteria bacterium]
MHMLFAKNIMYLLELDIEKGRLMESKHKIVKYAGTVIIATLFCRVLGLAREIVISNRFGAGWETDAFFIAFMIPNLLRSFLGEGALNSAFIPTFADYLSNHDRKKAEYFASNVLNILIIILIIMVGLGIWAAPWLINIIAIGFKSNIDKYQLAIKLTRVMFPYIGFVAVAAFFMSILNSYDHFLIPALSPAMLNISIIAFAFIFSVKYGIFSIAWGVLLGGIGQALIQTPELIKKKIKYSFVVDLKDPGTKKLLKLLIPAIIGLAVTQINVVVDKTLASTLIDGSISALYYSNRLVQFPLGAFGIAISIAIFPTLAKQTVENDIAELKKSLLFGLRILLFFTLPSAMGLMVLKDALIRLVYEHGIFSSSSTQMTASALFYYSIGLFAYACVRLITMCFYALKDAKTPVKIGIYIVLVNIGLDLILIRYLAHSGLALATSIAAIMNLIILLKFLQNKIGNLGLRSQTSFLTKIVISSIGLGIACILVENYFGKILDLNSKYNQIIQVTASIISGSLVYFMISYILRVKEIRYLKQSLKTILRSKE